MSLLDNVQQTFTLQGRLIFCWEDDQFDNNTDTSKLTTESFGYRIPINVTAVFHAQLEFDLLKSSFAFKQETKVVSHTVQFRVVLPQRFNLQRFPFDRQLLTSVVQVQDRYWEVLETPPVAWQIKEKYQPLCEYYLSDSVTGWHAGEACVYNASENLGGTLGGIGPGIGVNFPACAARPGLLPAEHHLSSLSYCAPMHVGLLRGVSCGARINLHGDVSDCGSIQVCSVRLPPERPLHDPIGLVRASLLLVTS